MSELLQSGHHPDADQLSAFVEHSLPTHEREETLAHLAICADCRAVVSLSMPPLEETLPVPEPTPRSWYFGWRLLWPIATAAALCVLLVVSIHIRSVSLARTVPTAPQMAVNRTPPLPVPAPLPQPAQSPPQEESVTPQSNLAGTRPAGIPQVAKPLESREVGSKEIVALPAQGREIAPLPTMRPRSLAPAAGAAPSTGSLSANDAGAALSQDAAMHPAAEAAYADAPAATPTVAANLSGQATTAPVVLQSAAPALRQSFVAGSTQAILSTHPLPSGLPALSIVTNARQSETLAVDIHGTLFLTADSGEHWTPIATQWSGRAVKVDLAYSGSSHGAGLFGFSAMGRTSQFAPQAGAVGGPVVISSGAVPSSLSGTVTDVSGAIIPGATVIVSASLTQLARMAKTDATGHYLVDSLIPGTYTVEANSPGFTRQQLSGIPVASGKPAVANLTLPVGSATQTVTVSAASPQLALEAPPAKMKSTPPAKSVPLPPVFEITTDSGEHWISADGRNWKHK